MYFASQPSVILQLKETFASEELDVAREDKDDVGG